MSDINTVINKILDGRMHAERSAQRAVFEYLTNFDRQEKRLATRGRNRVEKVLEARDEEGLRALVEAADAAGVKLF